jgi:hypothetical protein
LVQHGLQLQALIGFFAPNFPNYRLGPLKGSICDSLPPDSTMAVRDLAFNRSVLVYPNPATTEIHFEKLHGNYSQYGVIRLFEARGMLVVCSLKNFFSPKQTVQQIWMSLNFFLAFTFGKSYGMMGKERLVRSRRDNVNKANSRYSKIG